MGGDCGGQDDLWPNCLSYDTVYVGDAALDVSAYIKQGCADNNCKATDRFFALDKEECARVCRLVAGCAYWSFALTTEGKFCHVQTAVAVKRTLGGFIAGSMRCHPSPSWEEHLQLRQQQQGLESKQMRLRQLLSRADVDAYFERM